MNFIRSIYRLFFILLPIVVCAQDYSTIQATLIPESNVLSITQEIRYTNTSTHLLHTILLHDWSNSFIDNTTPLAQQFSQDNLRRFHFAKAEERGHTDIKSITTQQDIPLSWTRPPNTPDIIAVTLATPLSPNTSYTIRLQYTIKIASDKFTNYGYTKEGNYNLQYWYITPAIYDTEWHAYSNKNLDDLYSPILDHKITLTVPNSYTAYSELKQEVMDDKSLQNKTIQLQGKHRNEIEIYLTKSDSFYQIPTENGVTLISDIEENDLIPEMKAVAVQRIISFLENTLGAYPFELLMTTENNYKRNPVYGLNQLPDIVQPFPDGFQYEIKQLKILTENYLERTLLLHPRQEAWVKNAIHVYLMMEYTKMHYPKMKIMGKLSNTIGFRWFHASDLDFNDQYYLGYKNMARLFIDQPLNTPLDELIKFNKNIANPYKAGIGLKYLEAYVEDSTLVKQSIKEYYTQFSSKYSTTEDFKTILTKNTPKDISWFFDEYISTHTKLDYSIGGVRKDEDSLTVTLNNRKQNRMPVSLTALKDGKVMSKTWVSNLSKTRKVTIANPDIDKLVLDHEQEIPEVNRRNNHKKLRSISNRPIQFRFLQDVEDPTKNQVFYIPEFDFNVYDGFTIGSKFYNKTIIRKQFNYKIVPTYGFNSKKLIGSASLIYRQQVAEHGLYLVKYGISGNTFSYAPDLSYKRISPSINFYFRPKDLKSNKNQRLSIRNVNVFRDRDANNTNVNTPDYSIVNLRYKQSNTTLVHSHSYLFDYQLNKNFSKFSTTINYSKLFLNNRQLNLRLFAGTFLFNDTQKDGDFFSFSLDRPTDYLFDYGYLGRSESAGLASQQIILAEGGFKSKLENTFSNQWITTLNANTNIWNWIYAYGDIGWIKNKNKNPKFVYDAGVRMSLVANYFELFFPVVSNNGWEIAQPDYHENIRFIITLSPQTLIGLFTRTWY